MKRILAAVDVTSTGSLITQYAVELARAIDAKVKLVHVVVVAAQIPPPGVFVPPVSFRVQELTSAAERFLLDLQQEIPADRRDGIRVEVGSPPERICEIAHTYDPDVIVIGAHEYGLMARALGTTSSRIVNRADRPVFVVRPLPANHVVEAPAPAASSSVG